MRGPSLAQVFAELAKLAAGEQPGGGESRQRAWQDAAQSVEIEPDSASRGKERQPACDLFEDCQSPVGDRG